MPRSYCPRCDYPDRTCLCHAIDRTGYSIRLTILQHPSEAGHAKNTSRLITLVAEEAEVFIGEHPEDFNGVRQALLSNPGAVVLFPASTSVPLSEANQTSPVLRLVLIDGTWRKAKKSGCPIRGYSNCGSVTSMMYRADTVFAAEAYPEVWRRLKRLQAHWNNWGKSKQRPC